MNHVWVQIWPTIEADLEPADGAAEQHRPAHGRRRHRGGPRPGQHRRRTPDEAPLPIAGRFYYQPGSGVVAAVGAPPTEPLKPARRLRLQGRPGPPPRPRLPLRAAVDDRRRRRHRRRARPRRHRRARPGRPAARPQQGRHHRRPSSARRRRATREGVTRVVLSRRPAALARLGRRGRVRARHRGDRPRRADAGPARVVLPVGRRAHLDGLRHREHGLGGPRASSGSSSSPRRAARSTSSSPASTSAPSPTGTPRRRCSCTPRASSS